MSDIISNEYFKYSFAIKSSPEALLFFKFFIADFISSMVISSIWRQLKSHLRWIGPLRMTGSDVSHVPYPEVCSAHAQPKVAQYPL